MDTCSQESIGPSLQAYGKTPGKANRETLWRDHHGHRAASARSQPGQALPPLALEQALAGPGAKQGRTSEKDQSTSGKGT